MANLITRTALKAYLFDDVPNKDRFKQRVFPLQSDRPTEQTFENFVDTVATIGEVEDLSLVVATKATMAQVNAALVPYSTTSVSNTLYAAKSYESRVVAAELEIDALQAADLLIPVNYYNKTQSDDRFAPKASTDTRLDALEAEIDVVSDLFVYQEAKTKKRIDVEHFTWKPLKADDTYYLPFHPSAKVIIKSIMIANVSEWVIYSLTGTIIRTAIVIDQTNNSPLAVSQFNDGVTIIGADGILIVARTLNPTASGGLQIPPSVNLRVEYQYP